MMFVSRRGSASICLVAGLLLLCTSTVTAQQQCELEEQPALPARIIGVESCSWLTIQENLSLLTDTETTFEGNIILSSSSNTSSYEVAREQYAAIRYPDRTSPNVVAQVLSESDVQAVVRFAKQCNYSLSVRSGGHSYLGLSSCDDSADCIVLDVGFLNHTEIKKEESQLIAGPGNRLDALSEVLNDNGMWVPTGECAKVGLGGHVQTGGVGIWSRHFGPLSSRVEAFRIVLADGSIKEVTSPNETTSQLNNDLYYAVLGGSSGSWGVVTEITLNTVKDEDYFSVYWEATMAWDVEGVVNMFRTLADYWKENQDDQRWSTYFTMFTMYGKGGVAGFAIKVEMSWVAPKEEASDYDPTVFQSLLDSCTGCMTFYTVNEAEPLSSSLKNRYLNVKDGSEYPSPYRFYEKRLHQTSSIPSPDQMEAIIRLVDKARPAPDSPHLFLSQFFASIVHPGNYKSTISLPWQEDKIAMTFDFFYPDAGLAWVYEQAGESFSHKVVENFGGQDHRMFWGAFGDVDMKTDWPFYYDSKEKYERLRQIKACVDPDNLFSHRMSMPLPDDD